MQKLITFLTVCILFLSCNNKNSSGTNQHPVHDGQNSEKDAKSLNFEVEIDKWKKELLLNGEVGPPCTDDYQTWTEENTSYYWGMQDISSLKSDFNSDNNLDGLFYFPAVNCVGGNGTGSDFAILIYSNNNQTLTNKNITNLIASKLESALSEKGVYGVYDIVLTYKTFTKTIGGNYFAWSDEDAHCCPSNKGTFEYNPVDFTISINNKKEK
jgi:hypothetical protein